MTHVANENRPGLAGPSHIKLINQIPQLQTDLSTAAGVAASAQATANAALPAAGGRLTGAVALKEVTGNFAATLSPDITPSTGRQIFSYPVSAACTLSLTTSGLASDDVVTGSVFLTFSAAAKVTLAVVYKPQNGIAQEFTGAAGETWRVDFLYRKSVNRASVAWGKETA